MRLDKLLHQFLLCNIHTAHFVLKALTSIRMTEVETSKTILVQRNPVISEIVVNDNGGDKHERSAHEALLCDSLRRRREERNVY